MPRADGSPTTHERGLGWEHRRESEVGRRLALGQPCPYCGLPMTDFSRMDWDHVNPRAFGGQGPKRATHSRCNRRAGAILGNKLRKARRRITRLNSSGSW